MDELVELEPPVTVFREIAVIGGGCYGTFYAGQLRSAMARGKIVADRILLVDRDPHCQASREADLSGSVSLEVASWDDFLDRWLDRPAPNDGAPDDAIVPSPLMPHLMADWLIRLGRRLAPDRSVDKVAVERPLRSPYDVAGPDGNRYVSFADWLCPTHCVEPHICPVIKGPRTWEMSDALVDYVRHSRGTLIGPALLVTRHRAFGVGMFDAAEIRAGRALLLEALERPERADLLVGTISSCHGALSAIRIEACLSPGPSIFAA